MSSTSPSCWLSNSHSRFHSGRPQSSGALHDEKGLLRSRVLSWPSYSHHIPHKRMCTGRKMQRSSASQEPHLHCRRSRPSVSTAVPTQASRLTSQSPSSSRDHSRHHQRRQHARTAPTRAGQAQTRHPRHTRACHATRTPHLPSRTTRASTHGTSSCRRCKSTPSTPASSQSAWQTSGSSSRKGPT